MSQRPTLVYHLTGAIQKEPRLQQFLDIWTPVLAEVSTKQLIALALFCFEASDSPGFTLLQELVRTEINLRQRWSGEDR